MRRGILIALVSSVACAPTAVAEAPAELPKEVKDWLATEYRPQNPEGYFRSTPRELVDLNGDGTAELIVGGGCNKKDECFIAVFEKQGGNWKSAGDLLCDELKWKVMPVKSGWKTIACGDGPRYPFNAQAHCYGCTKKVPAPAESKTGFDGAMAAYQAGRFADAAKQFDAALYGAKATPEQRYWQAMAHWKAGDVKKARDSFSDLSLDSHVPSVLALADLDWEAGKVDLAKIHYDIYLKKSPTDEAGVARAKRRLSGEEKPAVKAPKK